MGVLTAVVNTFSTGEDGATDDSFDSFAYRCADCETAFERPKRQMTRVRCPDCRSPDVRGVD